MKLNIASIAKVCHEVNRAYCLAIGDEVAPFWETAPVAQTNSVMLGVMAVIDGSAATPEEQHELWCAVKLGEGWEYGPVKNTEKKLHPCLVPYSDLPNKQRAKDFLFRAIVESLR